MHLLCLTVLGAVVAGLGCGGCSGPGEIAEIPGSEVRVAPQEADAESPGRLSVGPAFREGLVPARAGGRRDVGVEFADCAGWRAEGASVVLDVVGARDLVFRLQSAEAPLAPLGLLLVREDADGAGASDLRCVAPVDQGRWHVMDALPAGAWRLWVTTQAADARPEVRVRIEPKSMRLSDPAFAPTTDSGRPAEVLDAGTFGGVVFAGDSAPVQWSGRAGGPRPAEGLGLRCAGWIAEVPDHVVVLERGQALRMEAEAREGIALAVLRPDGVWVCSDESSVLSPRLTASWPAGRLEVFVASLDPMVDPEYSLRVSR